MDDLKPRREALGLTQAALAMRCRCANSCISDIETGRETPSVDMAERIEKALMIGRARASDMAEWAKNNRIPKIPFKDEAEKRYFRKLWCERQG